MKINDLTRCPLKAKSYKDRGEISFVQNHSELTNEVTVNFSTIHMGTHIDFKSHKKLKDDKDTPSIIVFKEDEVFCEHIDRILDYNVQPYSQVKCLCIYTRMSELEYENKTYSFQFDYIPRDLCESILHQFPNLECLIIDSLSVGSPLSSVENDAVHRLILESNIIIVEDVVLSNWKTHFNYLLIIQSFDKSKSLDATFARVLQIQ